MEYLLVPFSFFNNRAIPTYCFDQIFDLILSETLASTGTEELTNPDFLPAFAAGGPLVPTIC